MLLGAGARGGVQADAEVTVGQKNEDNDVNTEVNLGGDSKTAQSAEKITNNHRMSPWVLLLIVLLAGWAIPDPYRMLSGIRNFFTKKD